MRPEEYRQKQADLAIRAESVALTIAATSTLAGYTLAAQLGTYLAAINAAATMLADVYTASVLRLRPLGLTVPENERDRLTAVMAGVLEDNRADPLPRIARLARTEPSTAARSATSHALIEHDVPEVRMQWVLDPDPCPLCLDLASRTYAPDDLPESHPHCECTVAPIITKETAA